MATLNTDEQAKVDRLAELEQHRRHGTQFVSDDQLERARELAAYAERNAEARARLQAQRQAEIDAKNAAHQARRDAEVLAAQEAYKRTARATFPGTQAQFDAAWPALLQQWQLRNTVTDTEAVVAEKRRQYAEYGF
jgi:hypothetical protein